jgi:hypothetical protein
MKNMVFWSDDRLRIIDQGSVRVEEPDAWDHADQLESYHVTVPAKR